MSQKAPCNILSIFFDVACRGKLCCVCRMQHADFALPVTIMANQKTLIGLEQTAFLGITHHLPYLARQGFSCRTCDTSLRHPDEHCSCSELYEAHPATRAPSPSSGEEVGAFSGERKTENRLLDVTPSGKWKHFYRSPHRKNPGPV